MIAGPLTKSSRDTDGTMGRRRLCLMAWTIAVGIVTGALSGSDSQCVANSGPTFLVVNQNKTLSFTAQSLANYASCRWIISSNSINTRLRLTAAIFNVRSSRGWCVDNFKVYDGNSSYSPVLLSTCSRDDFPIYSSGSDVLVSFTTGGDYSGQTSHFVINIEVFNVPDSVNVDTTSVHFLNYPERSALYPNNADRGWVLHTNDSQYVVHVTFTHVDVESSSSGCDYDYIEIFDSSMKENKLDRLCGSLSRREYYSTGQSLYITFHSDGSQTRSGFNLTYTAALRNTDCGWIIQSYNIDTAVHVTFLSLDFEMPDNWCQYDDIQLFDGSSIASNKLAKICGSQSQQEFYSSGQSLFVKFVSGSGVTRKGFNLSYEAVPQSENPRGPDGVCLLQGYVTSVNYDTQYLQYPSSAINYTNNANCSWLLQTSIYNYIVRVTFTFVDIETSGGCSYDYVHLFDGSSPSARSLGRVCHLTSREFYSSGPSMYITFHSNSVTTGRGFKLTYQAGSRSNVPTNAVTDSTCSLHPSSQTAGSDTEGYLQYPTTSSSYPNNADCGWLFESANYDYVVNVTFTFVDTEYSSNCVNDYIEVFDGSSDIAASLGKLCGSAVRDFYSSGHSVYIKFHSDNRTTGSGFTLTYQAVSRLSVSTRIAGTCSLHPSKQTASSDTEGYLQYPTNLSSYPNNADCGWVFQTANEDYVVHVTFTFVDTEYSSNCVNDYIEVFDGPYDYDGSLGRLCGSTVRDFYSSDDSMYIKFHSDDSTTGGGFRLTYKAVGMWDLPTYHGSTTPAIVGGAIAGSIVFVAAVFVLIVSVRRCQQSARNRPTNTNNNQNIVHFRPANGSAPQAGHPVIGGPPSVPAVPPSNISSPPSFIADPPSYEVVSQGTSYPNAGVHTMNHPLPQGSQYPRTRQSPSAPAGTQVTGGQVNQSFSF